MLAAIKKLWICCQVCFVSVKLLPMLLLIWSSKNINNLLVGLARCPPLWNNPVLQQSHLQWPSVGVIPAGQSRGCSSWGDSSMWSPSASGLLLLHLGLISIMRQRRTPSTQDRMCRIIINQTEPTFVLRERNRHHIPISQNQVEEDGHSG